MENVVILTVVPREWATTLKEKRRIINYNSLPQIDKNILEVVREFITEQIGYRDLPLACLSSKVDEKSLNNFIPSNSKNNVLFQLEMPADMIVSVGYEDLLNSSHMAKNADYEEIEIIKEEFKEKIELGMKEGADSISFIPFLDYSKCKFYSIITSDQSSSISLDLPGVKQIALKELTTFIK